MGPRAPECCLHSIATLKLSKSDSNYHGQDTTQAIQTRNPNVTKMKQTERHSENYGEWARRFGCKSDE